VRRLRRALVAAAITGSAWLPGQNSSGPSGADRDPTAGSGLNLMLVHDKAAPPRLQALLDALTTAVNDHPRLRAHQVIGLSHQYDDEGILVRTDPPRSTLAAYAMRADHVVCIGSEALRAFLVGRPLRNREVRIYCLGVDGLPWLPRENEVLPNLQRVRAGFGAFPALAETVRIAHDKFSGSSRMGVILSAAARDEPLQQAQRTAQALGLELLVERMDDPTRALEAVHRLEAAGIQVLLSTDDILGLAGPRGRLITHDLRLSAISRGIAVLGLGADEHAHGYLAVDPEAAATSLVSSIDRDNPAQGDRLRDPARDETSGIGLLPAPGGQILIDSHACAVDGIRLK